jgi:hypothetical protein
MSENDSRQIHASTIAVGDTVSFIPSIGRGVAATRYQTVTSVSTWATSDGTVIYDLHHVGGSMSNVDGQYLIRI